MTSGKNYSIEQYGRTIYYVSWAVVFLLLVYSVVIDIYLVETENSGSAHPIVDLLVIEILGNVYAKNFIASFGFALLISITVSSTIGRINRKNQDRALEKFMERQDSFFKDKIDHISKDVFRGIFGASYPMPYVEEIINTVYEKLLLKKHKVFLK